MLYRAALGRLFYLIAMEPEYEISLNMKTLKGMEVYGCFKLGRNEDFADSVYDSLLGDEEILPDSIITIDLVRRENGLLFPLAMRHCNYEQLAENVKIITRELFKKVNLEHLA